MNDRIKTYLENKIRVSEKIFLGISILLTIISNL